MFRKQRRKHRHGQPKKNHPSGIQGNVRFLGEGNAYGPGQGADQKLAFTSHATLMVAGEELGDQTVATLPLEWFSRAVGRSTDGFLGSNVFRNYVVEIDYANQVLGLHDPATYSYSGPGQRLALQSIWRAYPVSARGW